MLDTVSATEVNGHRFVVELPDEPLAAKADPEKLRQVCSILVDNALRYSPDGGTVTVGAARRQDTVEVSVADEGIGIPQSDQEQIFRKFYRGADAELRAGAGGTGLGLFIARGLVTAMGGQDLGLVAGGRGVTVRHLSFRPQLPIQSRKARSEYEREIWTGIRGRCRMRLRCGCS